MMVGMRERLCVIPIISVLCFLIVFGYQWSITEPNDLHDFGAFWAAGRLALDGLNPYGPAPDTLDGIRVNTGNANPPISLLPFQLFALLDPFVSFQVWRAISLVLFTVGIGLMACFCRPSVLHLLWAYALAGLWSTIDLGQIYAPLMLAVIGAWLLLERGRHQWAGLLIGIVLAIKPNFVIWPILLFIAGYHVVALASIVIAACLSLVPIVTYGQGIYVSWLRVLAGCSDPSNGMQTMNTSLFGLAGRLGLPWLGYTLALALLAFAVLWIWRVRPSLSVISAAGLIIGLLIAPIAWIGYTVLLLPVYLSQRWSKLLTLSAVLLVVPACWVWNLNYAPHWLVVLFGSIYCWALVLALVDTINSPFTRLSPRMSEVPPLHSASTPRSPSGSLSPYEHPPSGGLR